MCSHLLKMMENYQGDLADVVRSTTATIDGGSPAAELAAGPPASWQFPRNTVNYSSDPADQDFGDPFSYFRDPMMQNIATAPLSELFYGGAADAINNSGGLGVNPCHGVVDEMKRPAAANIFSRILQISPTAKLPLSTPDHSQAAAAAAAAAPPQRGPPILVSNNGGLISPSSSGLQISSPRNAGIKRRKSQAKKVVCIPAPAPANSRATGEIVPSDLWAWRKYGQKPIKGSPYPRGYYRCSSSKGCSARKQVERSRTDPNMLVITYTSEHNHPWPTQRNALAGSTRSQASKNNSSNAANNSSSPNEKPSNTKQEHKETSSTLEENCGAVKEEADQELENQFEAEFDDGFPHTYKPTLPDSSSNHDQDSFFADLGEIGDDPLNLFQQGFPRDSHHDLDPFSFYDWATNGSIMTATASASMTGSSGEESNLHS